MKPPVSIITYNHNISIFSPILATLCAWSSNSTPTEYTRLSGRRTRPLFVLGFGHRSGQNTAPSGALRVASCKKRRRSYGCGAERPDLLINGSAAWFQMRFLLRHMPGGWGGVGQKRSKDLRPYVMLHSFIIFRTWTHTSCYGNSIYIYMLAENCCYACTWRGCYATHDVDGRKLAWHSKIKATAMRAQEAQMCILCWRCKSVADSSKVIWHFLLSGIPSISSIL